MRRSGKPPRRVARAAVVAVAAAGLALVSACATPGLQQIQVDLDGVKQQLSRIEKDNATLSDQLNALRSVAGQQGLVESAGLKLRLDAIERDIAVLRSRGDDADQRLGAVAEDLRAARETLQTLIRSLPAASGVPPPPGAAVSSGGAATGAAAAGSDGGAAAPGGGASMAGGPGAAGGAGPAATAGTEPPEVLYRRGYDDFTRGNYALALAEAQDLVRRYPAHPLADDAQYLIGQVYEAQQHYTEAIVAYDQLLQAYPGGDKAPGAYLQKGLALLETNRTAEAVIQLQHVITAYPRSDEARLARERLRELGLKDR